MVSFCKAKLPALYFIIVIIFINSKLKFTISVVPSKAYIAVLQVHVNCQIFHYQFAQGETCIFMFC